MLRHMAQDELRVVSDNKWDDEIWGAVTPSWLSQPRSRLFILFGRDDRWVLDEVRDNLIMQKGRPAVVSEGQDIGKPVMVIDETGIPHDFCISHGIAVAKKVVSWVKNIIAADMVRS